MSKRTISSLFLAVSILLLAFALRLWGIADHSLWWDEGWSASLARKSVAEIVRFVAYDNHPPLHNLVLRGWWLLVGDGEFVMRYPSALFGLIWVALTYRLGFSLGKRRTAEMGALFIAISRFAIVWSQQVRMYTWSVIWTTLIVIAALNFWRKQRWQSLLVYIFAAVAALLSLYLTISAVITVNLIFLGVWLHAGKSQRLFIRWVSAQLGVVAIVMPWLLLNASQVETWTILQPITWLDYVRLYISMLVVGNPLNISQTMPYSLAAFTVFLFALVLILFRQYNVWHKIGLSTLLLGLIVQAVVVYAVCFGVIPGFARPLVPRYLLLMSTGFYIIPAWGISVMKLGKSLLGKRGMVVFFTGLFLVPQIIGLSTLYPGRVRRDDYVSISRALQALRQPDDAVVLYVDRDWPVFEAHYGGGRYDIPYGMKFSEDVVDTLLAPWWYAHEAVWVVTTPEALQTDPNQYISAWFASQCLRSETIIDGENKLTLYIRTPQRQINNHTLVSEIAPGESLSDTEPLVRIELPLKKYRTGDTIHLALIWAGQPATDYSVIIAGQSLTKLQPVEPLDQVLATGFLYQLVDIYLDPGMPGGKYIITVLDDNESEVTVTGFELVYAAAGLDLAIDQIPNPVAYTLGESIQLIGYKLSGTHIEAGGYLELTLYWRTNSPITDRYKVFTHVLGTQYNADTGNFLWGQLDNEPVNGQALTTLWAKGTVIEDPYLIPVDVHAPTGIYTLEVGMYGLVDAARLPVSGPAGRVLDDAIQLVSIEVAQP